MDSAMNKIAAAQDIFLAKRTQAEECRCLKFTEATVAIAKVHFNTAAAECEKKSGTLAAWR